MNTSDRGVYVFIRTAIAVLVAATVIQTGTAIAQTAPQPAAPPAAAQRHHSHIFRGLNLSQDQKAKIKSIRQKYHAQNQSITDRTQRRESMRAQRQEIMAVLNPDQRTKYQARLASLRQHHRQGQQAPQNSAPTNQ
jgi:Spy/CpxP family protein refolding chaperone